MPALAPDSLFVDIEFTPGTWTSVVDYVDFTAGLITNFGRTTVNSDPQPSTLSLTLDNTDGRFSPLIQVLSDGVTTHPYFPNVVPRKRIRFGYVDGGITYDRFLGYISGWPQVYKNYRLPRVTISATDQLTQLDRIVLLPAYQFEVAFDGPLHYWPCTDAQGATMALDANGGPALYPVQGGFTAYPLQFGVDGPGTGNGTAIQTTPYSTNSNGIYSDQYLSGSIPRTPTSVTAEGWMNIGTTATDVAWLMDAGGTPGGFIIYTVATTGYVSAAILDGNTTTQMSYTLSSTKSLADGLWHHVALVYNSNGSTILYVDGVSVASAVAVTGWTPVALNQIIGGYTGVQVFSFGQLALYPTALSATRIAAHFNAGFQWQGETTDARIGRILLQTGFGYNTSLDASTVQLSSYDQSGVNALSAIRDATTSEGNSSIFYVTPAGTSRFTSRNYRLPRTTVDATVDAGADLDGGSWTPAFDADSLINSSTATRSTASGSSTTQTWSNAASIANYGLASDSFTSWSELDSDVLYNAQLRVALGATPAYRLSKVTVDLFSSQNSTIYQTLGMIYIGSRLQVTNLPTTAGPASQITLFVEGWSDTVTDSGYTITFDTSPADQPSGGFYDSLSFGRAQCDGGQVLSGAHTSSTTVVQLNTVTASSPSFTVDPTMYPMTIQVDTEQITLTGPPATSVGAQTFSGSIRGVNGTYPAAHADQSVINLAPESTFAL